VVGNGAHCRTADGRVGWASCDCACRRECSIVGSDDTKIVYRQYATLYFVFAVDSSESELGILDLIQV